jgi:ABC-type nitrate/sulfonate/bicarbonate transport system substrate-binding protein
MRPGRIAVAAIAALLLLIPAVGRAAAPSVKEISIGLFPALRPLELVRGMHWLEDAGYTVTWHDFLQGIPPEAAAMAAGSIDFGEADTSGIEQVAAHSPGVMWYIADGATNYVGLVARKDSGITTVADLKGHKVGGVAPNTAPTAVLQMALAKVGLTLKDLQGYNIVGPSQPAALERGAIDAAISYVPYTAEAITSGSSTLITTASQVYGKSWPGGGVIVRPDFAKAHPDVVVDLLRYVARAEKMLKDQPQAAYKVLAAQSRTSLENVAYCYSHDLVQPTAVVPDKAAMVAQATVLKQFGVIDVPDVAAFIDGLVHPEFARQAVAH